VKGSTASCSFNKSSKKVAVGVLNIDAVAADEGIIESNLMYDECSDITLIREAFLRRLGISGSKCMLNITGVGGIQSRYHSEAVIITILDPDGARVELRGYSVPHVANAVPFTDWSKLKKKWNHLSDLPLRGSGGTIDILLGCDYARKMAALESRVGSDNEPVAAHTDLGWIARGVIGVGHKKSTARTHTIFSSIQTFVDLDQEEFAGDGRSIEDNRAIKSVEESTENLPGGEYSVGPAKREEAVFLQSPAKREEAAFLHSSTKGEEPAFLHSSTKGEELAFLQSSAQREEAAFLQSSARREEAAFLQSSTKKGSSLSSDSPFPDIDVTIGRSMSPSGDLQKERASLRHQVDISLECIFHEYQQGTQLIHREGKQPFFIYRPESAPGLSADFLSAYQGPAHRPAASPSFKPAYSSAFRRSPESSPSYDSDMDRHPCQLTNHGSVDSSMSTTSLFAHPTGEQSREFPVLIGERGVEKDFQLPPINRFKRVHLTSVRLPQPDNQYVLNDVMLHHRLQKKRRKEVGLLTDTYHPFHGPARCVAVIGKKEEFVAPAGRLRLFKKRKKKEESELSVASLGLGGGCSGGIAAELFI